jgi:hypothetical protein
MATGTRKYAFSEDKSAIIVEASVPVELKDALTRSYVAKSGKREGETRNLVILTDAGWSEQTGLHWHGYPVTAKVSFTVDLDGARIKAGSVSAEEFLKRRADARAATEAAKAAPATKVNGTPTVGARP